MTLHIEHDDDGGCFRLIEDGIGLCTSKSRNVLVRIRDSLNAVGQESLGGLTVETPDSYNTKTERVVTVKRGVVLAYSGAYLIVRLPDGQLDEWFPKDCRVVEPEKPARDTPGNEPAIGVYAALKLLERWLGVSGHLDGAPANVEIAMKIADETRKFLQARADAEPVP